MGGKRIVVDKTLFLAALEEVENKQTFRNWAEMQSAVANSSYGMSVGLSSGNVYQYILKFGITPKTPKGKRGAGIARLRDSNNTVRISRADKNKSPTAQESIKEVRRSVHAICGSKTPRYYNLMNKFEAGSMKAAISLQCLQCCGGEAVEVRNCEIKSCSLWLLRPWKAENNDDELAEILVDDVVEESNTEEPIENKVNNAN